MVDFEKVCDSVDWRYLADVMDKMIFPPMWCKWIFECVTTAVASVLMNGSPTNDFKIEEVFVKVILFLWAISLKC